MGIRVILAMFFLGIGLFFFFVTTIGVFRMKDFYSQLHAAGVSETVGRILSSVGLFIYEGFTWTGLKIFMVFLAVFLASPIGTHIIAKAAYKNGDPKDQGPSREGER